MSTEKMREEFRAWHSEQVARLIQHGEPTAAKVWRDFESLLWSTWQASHAAIEVELPGFVGYQEHIVRELQAAFQTSVEAAGLKVKP